MGLKTEALWLGLFSEPLPNQEVLAWSGGNASCGAVVAFFGNARDHSKGRPGVSSLIYEAYENQVLGRLESLAAEAQSRWPEVKKLALLHRIGKLDIGDTAVIAAAASPHRKESFAAADFLIEALKTTVPIWKKESWEGGESWGLEAQHITQASEID